MDHREVGEYWNGNADAWTHLARAGLLAEAFRVIRPGGFFQFSISHPCFDTPFRRTVRNEAGEKIGVEVGNYWGKVDGRVEQWIFSSAPAEVRAEFAPFKTPRFTRTLAAWLNLLIDTGFSIERLGEPYASDEAVRARPRLARARVVADFLQVRVRRPG